MDNDIQNVLAKELGIEHLPAEEQEKVRSTIGEAIMVKIAATMHSQLSDDDRATLESLTEESAIISFLNERIPDLDAQSRAIAKEVIDAFKKAVSGAA